MSNVLKSGDFSKDLFNILEKIIPSLLRSEQSEFFSHRTMGQAALYILFNKKYAHSLDQSIYTLGYIPVDKYSLNHEKNIENELGCVPAFNAVFINRDQFHDRDTVAQIYLARDGDGSTKDIICFQIDLECICEDEK